MEQSNYYREPFDQTPNSTQELELLLNYSKELREESKRIKEHFQEVHERVRFAIFDAKISHSAPEKEKVED